MVLKFFNGLKTGKISNAARQFEQLNLSENILFW